MFVCFFNIFYAYYFFHSLFFSMLFSRQIKIFSQNRFKTAKWFAKQKRSIEYLRDFLTISSFLVWMFVREQFLFSFVCYFKQRENCLIPFRFARHEMVLMFLQRTLLLDIFRMCFSSFCIYIWNSIWRQIWWHKMRA